MIVDYSLFIVCALGIIIPAIIGMKFPKWQSQCIETICFTAMLMFFIAVVLGIIKIYG